MIFDFYPFGSNNFIQQKDAISKYILMDIKCGFFTESFEQLPEQSYWVSPDYEGSGNQPRTLYTSKEK